MGFQLVSTSFFETGVEPRIWRFLDNLACKRMSGILLSVSGTGTARSTSLVFTWFLEIQTLPMELKSAALVYSICVLSVPQLGGRWGRFHLVPCSENGEGIHTMRNEYPIHKLRHPAGQWGIEVSWLWTAMATAGASHTEQRLM